MVRLYQQPRDEVFSTVIEPFIESERDRLAAVYEQYEGDKHANPLLFQPEALLIFERLQNDPDRLKAEWPVDQLPARAPGVDGLDLGCGPISA